MAGPLYKNDCPTCEYVMSFAGNDWYICQDTVVCQFSSLEGDTIAAPIIALNEFDGMMCQAKVVYQFYRDKKKSHQISRLAH